MEQDLFEKLYQAQAPWDIGRPQPDIVRLEEAGLIGRSVLDAGCGTGDVALYLAERGHDVRGIDFVPIAIERARQKASAHGLNARFDVGDALRLADLNQTFDTVIDCGLFHTFDEAQRTLYLGGLRRVVQPGGRVIVLCFSEHEPPGEGPRRVSRAELEQAFHDGWRIEEIRETAFQTADYPGAPQFSPGGPRAYAVRILRTSDAAGSM